MELDEMKQAWQALDQRLQTQHTLNLQLFRSERIGRLRRGLRPLFWGQALQILAGVFGLLLVAPIWMAHWRQPAVLISGLVIHAYCIGLIVIGAMVQSKVAHIDHDVPVLELQKRLAGLRHTFAVLGAVVGGLPWWFLTAPLLVVLSHGTILVSAPAVIWWQLAVGGLGLAASWAFWRWAHGRGRERVAHWLERRMSGTGIMRAQAALDEIARFEQA